MRSNVGRKGRMRVEALCPGSQNFHLDFYIGPSPNRKELLQNKKHPVDDKTLKPVR